MTKRRPTEFIECLDSQAVQILQERAILHYVLAAIERVGLPYTVVISTIDATARRRLAAKLRQHGHSVAIEGNLLLVS